MCLRSHERAAFIFLNAIPYVDIETLPSSDENCAICTEPYLEGPRRIRDPLDTPVKLRCGHIYGHNCLVRWMLSDNFDNHCAFCRAQIIDQSDLQKSPDPIVVLQLYYFENFVLDQMERKTNRKQELLELFDRYLTVIKNVGYTLFEMFSKARVVMIWEEFLAMVDEEERQRLRLREARLERDRCDTAEAALRLERQQEMDRQWSEKLRNVVPIIASFTGVAIASRSGLW